MRIRGRTTLGILILCLSAGASQGSLIVYGTQSDSPLVPGASLSDVRLSVDLAVADGKAVFSFTNASVAPENSAVFKEIVIDSFDGDTGRAILWNGTVLTNTPSIAYTIHSSNGLPGYHNLTSEAVPLIELDAKSPPPKRGIGPGELLEVQFDTWLSDGSLIQDYLAFFGGGSDTSVGAIGFHAISADVVNGESLSGFSGSYAHVPEPSTAIFLVAGASLAIVRRRNRRQLM